MSTETNQAVASETPQPEPTKQSPPHGGNRGKRILAAVLAVVVVIIAVPKVLHAFRTVSTDDAYLNSYVTFVAPRVKGQVLRVLVDDNNRARKGDVLVELDPEPYQVQVAIKQAALDAAKSDLVAADASVRSQIGQTRGLRFKLQHAIEDVDNQVAVLRSRTAALVQAQATLTLAQTEFDRFKKLLESKAVSTEEFDQKREALDVSNAKVEQAAESIYQQRAALGLPRVPDAGKELSDVPADLDQTFSTVRQSLGDLLQGAAQLGVSPSSYNLTPKEVVAEFYRRDPDGDINKIYAAIIKDAPAIKQAEARLEQAQRDLDSANLDLRYCRIVAEIDGVVTRRNVNPGNNVQPGQSLMALRSLTDIWVDANFKETQLKDLRIGQRVELKVDMYGGKHKFEGRVSGFSMGTGSTLALLPAQNASGNFVKVVQRLPVRIDLVDYNPEIQPLFVGLSVEPEVDIRSAPTGQNAGRFLQEAMIPKVPPKP
jgi:membrane fusion protein (multidrug efflux system)